MLGLIFFASAMGKITDFQGTLGYMKSKGMTMATEVFLVAAIVLLLFGSISLFTRIKLKWGIGALLLFLISATAIFHNDLGNPDPMTAKLEMIMLMKNISMMGGLICVAVLNDYVD